MRDIGTVIASSAFSAGLLTFMPSRQEAGYIFVGLVGLILLLTAFIAQPWVMKKS